MAKNLTLAFVSLLISFVTYAKDIEVMKVNGKSVTLSEFEYLYNKNKQQQVESQPFDKYVEMFVNYKLKVADAETSGIDTTKSFIREFSNYCRELAKPYLEDKEAKENLIKENYQWMCEDVDVSHIMLPLVDTLTNSRADARAFADSVVAMLKRGDDFRILTLRFSVDPAKMYNMGRMGYLPWGRVPASFERAAHNTPVDSFSDVVETPFGFHIIKVHDKKPAKTVRVQHILKLIPRGADAEAALNVKNAIDSIYNVVINGGDFTEIAKIESDDSGSKSDGGELPWFGVSQMVKEFEDVAFALQPGEISQPFKTSYGYHIIKKLEEKTAPSFEESLPKIEQRISGSELADYAIESRLNQLKNKFNYKVNSDVIKELSAQLPAKNQIDSAFIESLANNNSIIADFDGGNIKVSTIYPILKQYNTNTDGNWLIEKALEEVSNAEIENREISDLKENNNDYRNIVNEYREGLLLFDISNKTVWDKANRDTEGLTQYFNANKEKYTWTEPRFKGYLIQAANDSIAQLIKSQIENHSEDSLARVLKRDYKGNVKVEKMVVTKGDNKLIDACVFNNDNTFINPNTKLPIYFTHNGRIVNQPEILNDVRSSVVVDYQNLLEEDWIKRLRKKYKVKINKKNLAKVKQ